MEYQLASTSARRTKLTMSPKVFLQTRAWTSSSVEICLTITRSELPKLASAEAHQLQKSERLIRYIGPFLANSSFVLVAVSLVRRRVACGALCGNTSKSRIGRQMMKHKNRKQIFLTLSRRLIRWLSRTRIQSQAKSRQCSCRSSMCFLIMKYVAWFTCKTWPSTT